MKNKGLRDSVVARKNASLKSEDKKIMEELDKESVDLQKNEVFEEEEEERFDNQPNDGPNHTKWADDAYQLGGGDDRGQQFYDRVMSKDRSER